MGEPNLRTNVSLNYMNLPAKDNFPLYTTHECMVRKHLTPEIYEKNYKKVTKNGVTFDKTIQPSCDNTSKLVGLVAGDEESYEEFKDLFDLVIDDYHQGFKPDQKHPAPDLDATKLTNGELDAKYVKSCRIRTGRSIRGLCLPPSISRAERREVQKVISEALSGLGGDLKGTYYKLATMTPEDEKKLIEDHFLFQKPNGHLMVNSNAVRDWPDGRGIWHNDEKTFLVWVNEEDHCRVISMQQGGSMQKTFERFCRGLQEVERLMKASGREFMHSDRLGYLCTCPTNIGTGLRCSVHVQLHKLSQHPKFEDIVVALGLQKRGTAGEHTAAVDDIYDLSNRARLKNSEREFVQIVIDGVRKIIEMEQALEAGKSIDDLIPKGCNAGQAAIPSAADNFPLYTTHECMVRKHLTPEIYEKNYKKVTKNGVTFDKTIQPSCDNTSKLVGLVAGDEESYETFKDIFDLVIDDYHQGFKPDQKHPSPDLDATKLAEGDLDDKYVKSCRIRTGRSIRGLCLPPSISRAERREVQKVISEALSGLSGDLKGTYYKLATMTPEDEKKLIEDHFLFQKPTGHLMVNSNAVRDWPDGRGIWHNDEKTFLVWVNEEDHCRVISMQQGGSMQKTFARFCRGLQEVERLMKASGREFMHSDRLGYLCTCPTNIGTGLRCSVHVQLHQLSKHPKFDDIVVALGLQKRGTAGEHTAAVDDIYDLSNRARLKNSEREFVQIVINGVRKIIAMEQALEAGKPIDDLIPQGV